MCKATQCSCDESNLVRVTNAWNHPKYIDGTCVNICVECSQQVSQITGKILTSEEIVDNER